MNIIDNMISFYNEQPGTSAYRPSIEKILKNLPKVPDMGIEELAEFCDVSTPTMVRLVRRFGSDSYRQFREDIAKTLKNYHFENRCFPYVPAEESLDNICNSYFLRMTSMLDGLQDSIKANSAIIDNVCLALHESDRVLFFVTFPNTPASRQFQTDLIVAGKITGGYATNELRRLCLDQLTEKSVVICDVFYAGYNASFNDDVETLKEAALRGARTVVICPDNIPVGSDTPTYLLRYKATGTSMDRYQSDIFLNLLMIRHRALYIDKMM